MAPRSRTKGEARLELDDGRPTIVDIQGGNAFAQLAKKHWLKSSKKLAKVQVKQDVLKSEIWDVLEQEDFAFKSLLILENLQILEKYSYLSFIDYSMLSMNTATFGQDIPRTRPTFTCYSLC